MKTWDLSEAIELCSRVESICPAHGFHVALTGGLLYKGGIARKDLDLVFYRIRQVKPKERQELTLMQALADIGIKNRYGGGWCYKAEFNGKPIDCLFPETGEGEYEPEPSIMTSVEKTLNP